MADHTNIEWCDATLNLWTGCTKVSDGCKFCYAENMRDNRLKLGEWGPSGTRREVKSWRSTLEKISKRAKSENRRLKVFCQSMSDTFEGPETMGGEDSYNWQTVRWLQDRLFEAMWCHPELDFLILTKRPENALRYFEATYQSGYEGQISPNIWIGTSVEDQKTADERIPRLLAIPAAVRFLSCEPLLGPVNLSSLCVQLHRVGETTEWLNTFTGEVEWEYEYSGGKYYHETEIHWVIVGGESGPNARPMNPDWARSLRDQCQAAGVPFFFKQWGEWVSEMHNEANPHAQETSDAFVKLIKNDAGQVIDYEGVYMCRAGKKKAGRILDGREWSEFPEVYR